MCRTTPPNTPTHMQPHPHTTSTHEKQNKYSTFLQSPFPSQCLHYKSSWYSSLQGDLSPFPTPVRYVFLSFLPFELWLSHSLKTMFPNAWPLNLPVFFHCLLGAPAIVFIVFYSLHLLSLECLFLPMPIHLCCDFFYVEVSQSFYLQHILLPNISPLAISFAPKTSAMPSMETIQMSICTTGVSRTTNQCLPLLIGISTSLSHYKLKSAKL